MTTIILTIIGILLAAAAALMVIFYGGDAFNSGTVGAQANQLQNAGTNVISAVQMFKAERATAPASLADLLTAQPNGIGAYLDEEPALATGQAATLQTAGTPARQLYVVSGVSEAVCDRVNTNLRLAPAQLAIVEPATAPADAAGAAAIAAGTGAPKMGCYSGGFFVARA